MMNSSNRDSSKAVPRATNLTLTLFGSVVLSGGLLGQSTPAPQPGPQLQYADVKASAKTITVSRAPVVTEKGQTVYQDISIQFAADADGNLSLAEGFPLFVLSPAFVPTSFRAGKYVGPRTIANGKAFGVVSGPSALAGGAASWSFAASTDADSCTFPGSASWYVGPLENSPVANRLKNAGNRVGSGPGFPTVGITSTAWSYGVAGASPAPSCFGGNNSSFTWQDGVLLGVSAAGNSITFASFTNNGSDYSAPVAQITYVLQ